MKKIKNNLTINDFQIIQYISYQEIRDKLDKREYKKFLKWMAGQTCVADGVYPDDLERYLEGRAVTD